MTISGSLSQPASFFRRHPILAIGGGLLLCLCAWRIWQISGFGMHQKNAAANAPYVKVAPVEVRNFPINYVLLGTVVPITNVTITPRVTGHILDVFYNEGQYVKQGDELELIDPRPYQAALEQAQGTLEADQAQLDKARIDNQRYQKLLAQKSTSAMLARDQEFTVHQLEGQVAMDKGILRAAQLNLDYCHIIAPVSGRVGIRALDRGNYVTAGQSGGLTTLTQMEPISVIFTLPQKDLPAVYSALHDKGSLPVEAWDSNNSEKLATGTVKALDSQIDTATGTVRLRGIFPNTDHKLFPNQFVNIHLTSQILMNIATVPVGAVQTGPDGNYVYKIEKAAGGQTSGSDEIATVVLQPVQIAASGADVYAIDKGLNSNDQVVTDGVDRIHPDSLVHVISETHNPANGS